MSLVKRLLTPHYMLNVMLALSFPMVLFLEHPEYFNSKNFASYLRYLFPVLVLLFLKIKGAQSAEELISVLALYGKTLATYGFWYIQDDHFTMAGSSWNGRWRLFLFLMSWLVVFILFPQPPYRGPSNVLQLNLAQLEYITTPGGMEKAKEKAALSATAKRAHAPIRRRPQTAKIVELDENGEPLESDTEENDQQPAEQSSQEQESEVTNDFWNKIGTMKLSDLDSSHYWVISFNTTWSSPCRYFEAVMARCSIKYSRTNVHFAKVDLDLEQGGDDVADRFRISMQATTIDLPTLILFRNGEILAQLPRKANTKVGGEMLGKMGWDRSEQSVVEAFELAQLGTGRESFARKQNGGSSKK